MEQRTKISVTKSSTFSHLFFSNCQAILEFPYFPRCSKSLQTHVLLVRLEGYEKQPKTQTLTRKGKRTNLCGE